MTTPTDPSIDPAMRPVRPAVNASKGSTSLNILLGAAVFLAVGGVAFAVGRLTAPATAAFPNGGPGNGQFPGGGNFPGGPGASFVPGAGGPGGGFLGNGGVTLEGTVESKDADSLTLKLTNGQTVEISLPSDTTYHTQAAASGDSVQSGATVRVQVDVAGGQAQGQGQFSASDVTVVP